MLQEHKNHCGTFDQKCRLNKTCIIKKTPKIDLMFDFCIGICNLLGSKMFLERLTPEKCPLQLHRYSFVTLNTIIQGKTK